MQAMSLNTTVLQKIGAHTLMKSNVKARASGELKVIRNQEISDRNRQLLDSIHVIIPPSIPSPPQGAGTPPPPPPPLPDVIGPFNANPISFDNGVPVGGSMVLSLSKDGSYSFSGHFHDSGFPSYDVDGVWVIVSNSGKAFTFEQKGSMYGTLQSGSRSFDFAQNGKNDALRDAWADLCDGYHWRWSAYVNWDIQQALNDTISALKTAGTIIAAVVAIV